jgi:hypothetical protein
MIDISRRTLIAGLIAAPFVIRASGLLMPVRQRIVTPVWRRYWHIDGRHELWTAENPATVESCWREVQWSDSEGLGRLRELCRPKLIPCDVAAAC